MICRQLEYMSIDSCKIEIKDSKREIMFYKDSYDKNFRLLENPKEYKVNENVTIAHYVKQNIMEIMLYKPMKTNLTLKQINYINDKIYKFGYRWKNILRLGKTNKVFDKNFTSEELRNEYEKINNRCGFRLAFNLSDNHIHNEVKRGLKALVQYT